MAMLYIDAVTKPVSLYKDRRFVGDADEREAQLLLSATLYVGNLSFYTTEEQVFELFSKAGEIKRIVMGLDKFKKTPCGFCFVEYFTRKDAEASVRHLSGVKLDERFIRVDYDAGFSPGRQFGRGRSGGQVRDEYRTDYDPGRGGYGHIGRMTGMQLWGEGAGGGYGSGNTYVGGPGMMQGNYRANGPRQGRRGGRYGPMDRAGSFSRRPPQNAPRGGLGARTRSFSRGGFGRGPQYGRGGGVNGGYGGYGRFRGNRGGYNAGDDHHGDEQRHISNMPMDDQSMHIVDSRKRPRDLDADPETTQSMESDRIMPTPDHGQSSPKIKRQRTTDDTDNSPIEAQAPVLESSEQVASNIGSGEMENND